MRTVTHLLKKALLVWNSKKRNKRVKLLLFFFIAFSSITLNCRDQEGGKAVYKNGTKDDNSCFQPEFDSALLKLSEISFFRRDSSAFKAIWSSFLKNDSSIIEYLACFKNDRKIYKWCSTTDITDFNNTMNKHDKKPAMVASLFLINALYYENYSFANSQGLYFDDKLVADTMCGKTIWKEDKFNAMIRSVSMDEIAEGWLQVEKWLEQMRQHSLKYMRENRIRPFMNSSLFWYGEKGGKINRLFYVDSVCP